MIARFVQNINSCPQAEGTRHCPIRAMLSTTTLKQWAAQCNAGSRDRSSQRVWAKPGTGTRQSNATKQCHSERT